MRTFRIPLCLATIIVSSLLWSCQEVDVSPTVTVDPPSSESQPSEEWDYREGMTVLGKRLDNPYTVENMRKAWASLVASDPSLRASDIRIFTSHLHIRFKPRNEEELSIIRQDPTLILFPYPMDYEIIQGGHYYHDPEVPKDRPTYQYCSVPVGKVLPSGVEYELLAEAFIPEEVEMRNRVIPNGRVDQDDLTDALVYEAHRLTGNLDSPPPDPRPRTVRQIKSVLRGRFGPSGRIRAWDDDWGTTTRYLPVRNPAYAPPAPSPASGADTGPNSRYALFCDPASEYYDPPLCGGAAEPSPEVYSVPEYIYRWHTFQGSQRPLEGVTVTAKSWFRAENGTTDANGEFSINSRFLFRVRYHLFWSSGDKFKIMAGSAEAKVTGPKGRSSWNLDIGQNELQQFYADIYRGAYRYYVGRVGYLASYRPQQPGYTYRPPPATTTVQTLRISARNSSGQSVYNSSATGLPSSISIHIFRQENGVPISSARIVGNTLRQLARSAYHANSRSGSDYTLDNHNYVKESWAVAAEWYLMDFVYPNLSAVRYYPSQTDDPITGVLIDLINEPGESPGTHDQIVGLDIRDVLDLVRVSRGWNDLRVRVKTLRLPTANYHSYSSPPGPWSNSLKNSRIDRLFAYWAP